jgi:hypothetical protein
MLDISRSPSEVSKYQDPLRLLQDYVTEVNTAGLMSCLCCLYAPDLDVNYAAGN